MSDVVMQIDGKEVKASDDMTVLQAARAAGIHIPTLCHHEKLEPFGGCRMCMVEVETRGRKSYVVSCLYPVAKDLVVRTRSERVDKIRRVILEELLAHAPNSPELVALAREYRADRDRFDKDPSFCILCGLCVRYCAEVKQKNAVGFIENGARAGDQLHSRDRRKRVLGLPGVLRAVPDFVRAGRLLPDRSAGVSRQAQGKRRAGGLFVCFFFFFFFFKRTF